MASKVLAEFSWIYLAIFLIIPLSRIIPRLLAKRRMKNSQIQEKQVQPSFEYSSQPPKDFSKPQREFSKPQSKDMIVLGELNFGVRTFEGIQKNTGLDAKELDSILQELEKDGLLEVHKKQGLFGPKVELHPTDKGQKKFYS
ncbi:MAG: hypothetical protein ACE5RJ_00595 [Nitrosopumilaceae archaeon]